jgi:predicted acylesterase/phospholipase RssA
MNIKHLVLTGGGPVGLVEYGALKYLTEKKYIVHENIESIYATSIGSFIGLIYLLNIDWLWVDDYLIKKPWKNVVNFSYTNLVYDKGIINRINLQNRKYAKLFFISNLFYIHFFINLF